MWDPSNEFEVGMIFPSREAVQKAAKEYHLLRHNEFCYEETKSRTYAIRCKDRKSNCKWRMRASRWEGSDIWKVTRYNGLHTCVNPSISQDHKQLDSRFIFDFILAIVREQPNVKISALQAEIKDKVGYMPSYRKTWKARHDAIVKIFGGWEESFTRLRQFMLALCKHSPNSAFLIEDDPLFVNNKLQLDYRVFNRMFWALKQTIEGFKHCRPIIFIASTFLYGKYKGCLFCAPALDDRHIGIKKAMQQDWWRPPDGHHRYYLRHILSNYNTKFKNTDMKEALRKAVNLKFGRVHLGRSTLSDFMKGHARVESFKRYAFHVPMS
ncbi:uncharacterized protein LOC131178406 [Hevea brasiliensis]|uniref:uncharacterized protein LOC131178406 n=1 Tax=Hevea brasiliensis TaxID=3981 RepID=UPI0025D7EE0C|nr:uncharacterized protein LOC131178406 [Hevea brasiliensis]